MSLRIENLNVEIDEHKILHHINLNIQDGELLSLLGSSGCGKSTLLKAVAGLLDLGTGEIYMNDRRIDNQPVNQRGAVVVFQDLRLFSNMNVIDNVSFPLKMQGVAKESRREKAKYYLEMVQLSGLEGRRISQLSGGQQQRVALARALAAEPTVLLLDEPFSSLDENLRGDMRQLLRKLHQELHNTIVLVTHDREEALQLSDRIAIMREGRILQCDTAKRIYENPTSVEIAQYLGSGNLISGQVKHGLFTGDRGGESFSIPVDFDDGKYRVLIGHEGMSICDEGVTMWVEQMAYLGERYELILRLGEQTIIYRLKGRDMPEKLKEGDKIHLKIHDCGLKWFKIDEFS